MTKESVCYLEEKIDAAIQYCRMEYDMTLAEAVGTLLVTAQELNYAFGKPAKMIKPVIFFYEKGKVKTIIKGDLGEIGFGTKFDPEKLKVWGNMEIHHFGGVKDEPRRAIK